jgi:hypothetical protein
MRFMNFSEALQLLKDGACIGRIGWNGKGMFLFLIPDWKYTDGKHDNYDNAPFIAMKTADNKTVPWLASQTDILANDWAVFEP